MENKYFWVVILFVGLCHGLSKAKECTARGRFPNDETADCRGYTMCLLGGLTNFTQYKLTCPMGIYSHIEEQCTNSTSYKCYPDYNCTGVGNFPDPESTDCSSYVACIEGLGNVGTARIIQCPPNTLFDSTAGLCVNSTVFSCPTSWTLPTVPVLPTTTRNPNNGAVAVQSFLLLISVILLQVLHL